LVSAGDVILVSAIGLAIFFSKDIIGFLNSLKGFSVSDIAPQLNINIPPLPPLPEIPIPPEISAIPTEVAKIFTEPQISVLAPVFEAGVETRIGVDKALFDLEQSSENFAEQVKTQVGEVELGFQQTQTNIADFFTGISTGFTTFFGGQQEPKMILSKETATQPPPEPIPILQKKAGVFEPTVIEKITEPIIEAQQPDLSLVSPFLTGGTVIEEEEKTRGELRFGR